MDLPNAGNRAVNGATEATTPSAARVTKRRAQTQQRLLDAALEVFAERGFGAASVEEVCTRAGYTRGAFYSNFISLDQLFLEMWEQRSAAVLAAAAEALEEASRDTVTTLEDGVDRLLGVIVVDDAWFRIQSEFTAHALRSDLRDLLAAREEQIAENLLPFVDSALAQMSRRAPDRHALLAALVAVHEGSAIQCLVDPDGDADQRRRTLFLAVFHAYTEEIPK